jgi:hypothetical protein
MVKWSNKGNNLTSQLSGIVKAARREANIVVADLKSDISCQAMQEIKMKILKLFLSIVHVSYWWPEKPSACSGLLTCS